MEEEEQDAGTGRLSEDHNRAEWIQCTKCLRWDKNFVLVEEFDCAPCQE